MSIADQVAIENLQKEFQELKTYVNQLVSAFPELTKLQPRVEELENKYRMLNARMGWKKE